MIAYAGHPGRKTVFHRAANLSQGLRTENGNFARATKQTVTECDQLSAASSTVCLTRAEPVFAVLWHDEPVSSCSHLSLCSDLFVVLLTCREFLRSGNEPSFSVCVRAFFVCSVLLLPRCVHTFACIVRGGLLDIALLFLLSFPFSGSHATFHTFHIMCAHATFHTFHILCYVFCTFYFVLSSRDFCVMSLSFGFFWCVLFYFILFIFSVNHVTVL